MATSGNGKRWCAPGPQTLRIAGIALTVAVFGVTFLNRPIGLVAVDATSGHAQQGGTDMRVAKDKVEVRMEIPGAVI